MATNDVSKLDKFVTLLSCLKALNYVVYEHQNYIQIAAYYSANMTPSYASIQRALSLQSPIDRNLKWFPRVGSRNHNLSHWPLYANGIQHEVTKHSPTAFS
jgi:hypothetical protein